MSAPMLPPAPGRLSITTGWPHDSVSFLPISRPNVSATPPTGNGTTMRIGLSGYVGACADAKVAIGSIAAPSSIAIVLRVNWDLIVVGVVERSARGYNARRLAVEPVSAIAAKKQQIGHGCQ